MYRNTFARVTVPSVMHISVDMSTLSVPTLRKVDHSPINEGQLLSLWCYNVPNIDALLRSIRIVKSLFATHFFSLPLIISRYKST